MSALNRPLRTGVQATTSTALVEFIDAFLWDMSDRQYAALVVLLTMIIGYIQVLTENHFGKGVLRDPGIEE